MNKAPLAKGGGRRAKPGGGGIPFTEKCSNKPESPSHGFAVPAPFDKGAFGKT